MKKEYEAPANKALTILSLTAEGSGLFEHDYYLVSRAIRGTLDQEEMELLYRLHAKVVTGNYQARWYMGVEPMTVSENGDLYYKRTLVLRAHEVPASLHAAALEELSHRCRHLEKINADINAVTLGDRWLVLSELSFTDPYVTLICRLYKVISDRNRTLLCLRAYPFGVDSDAVGYARSNGENWMVMNYHSSAALDAYLAKLQPLSARNAVDLWSMAGKEVLRYFHDIGVPRDLTEQVTADALTSAASPDEGRGQAGQIQWGPLVDLI